MLQEDSPFGGGLHLPKQVQDMDAQDREPKVSNV